MSIRRLMAVVVIAALVSAWLAHARDVLREDADFGGAILLVELFVLSCAAIPLVIATHITRSDAAYAKSLAHRCESPAEPPALPAPDEVQDATSKQISSSLPTH
jgi:hypothetical protein